MSDWGKYIGIPWENGAQGPDAYDCWSFFRDMQRTHFERELPIISVNANSIKTVISEFQSNDEYTNWEQVEMFSQLEGGDAVLMSQSRYPSHVGIWIEVDGGGVLHCVQGSGVIFSSATGIGRDGWSNVKLYKYRDTK